MTAGELPAVVNQPAFGICSPICLRIGQSGCRANWMITTDDYAARTASERPLIVHDISGEPTPTNLRDD
jgi:hypothetical protein